jgi:hypothetical protein
MENSPVRLMLTGIIVASLALAFSSQTQAFSLPCNKVLTMTPQAWSEFYTVKNSDTSELAQDQAAWI